MMLIKAPALIGFTLLLCSFNASATDCGRAATVVENTLCDNPELVWLDQVFNNAFHELLISDPPHFTRIAQAMMRERNACVSNSCLRRTYLGGLSQLYGADREMDWQGVWWNMSAPHGNGGKIRISQFAGNEFNLDASVWGGYYQSSFSGKVTLTGGVGFTHSILWGGGCAIVLTPRPDNRIEVSSDSHGRCDMLLPGKMSIDGVYVKADNDPRPAATLLTLGILPNKTLDDRFRQLVGNDYAGYVATATSFVYSQDLDQQGATVLTLWVKGMANRRSAMIMYTPEGQIWALRVSPDKDNSVKVHYVTTEKEKQHLPKTLSTWRTRFIDRQVTSSRLP